MGNKELLEKAKKERVGQQIVNKWGSLMTIVEYKSNKNITVEFENGYRTDAQYPRFKQGSIKSPYDKTIYKIGYIGEGIYTPYNSEQNKNTIQYEYWIKMFARCYDEKTLEKYTTYENKYVCEEWHNFQNFAKWFDENYYKVDGQRMQLDKDILFKDNRIYSPDTCVFVPQRINTLFVKCDKSRGEYPIGVSFNKKRNKLVAQCSIFDLESNKTKKINLGDFNKVEEAFNTYKRFKESYIKEVANEYRNQIPQNLYNAMCNYVVEIDD